MLVMKHRNASLLKYMTFYNVNKLINSSFFSDNFKGFNLKLTEDLKEVVISLLEKLLNLQINFVFVLKTSL